jgi:hypothetical protein
MQNKIISSVIVATITATANEAANKYIDKLQLSELNAEIVKIAVKATVSIGATLILGSLSQKKTVVRGTPNLTV